MSLRVKQAGGAALAALRAGPAKVFASFERSCYVETPAGIACLGTDIGLGPLNAIAEDFESFPVGNTVSIECGEARLWKPAAPSGIKKIPGSEIPASIREPAQAFLDWIAGTGRPDDALIGLGPGLTPAGDDFVGGAMIALRAFGRTQLADRIAAWALPLAKERTNRISRAHLECAAAGEGHEALHLFLCSFEEKHLEALGRIGHTSGLDAAAGALLALGVVWRPHGDSNPGSHRERVVS
jgi:Protein of unknown function (DUF2877)